MDKPLQKKLLQTINMATELKLNRFQIIYIPIFPYTHLNQSKCSLLSVIVLNMNYI
jgi:hypothetical protein